MLNVIETYIRKFGPAILISECRRCVYNIILILMYLLVNVVNHSFLRFPLSFDSASSIIKEQTHAAFAYDYKAGKLHMWWTR